MIDTFFGFLYALFTFEWLKDREDQKSAESFAWMTALPWKTCVICGESMWCDFRASTWKHVSNNKVVSSHPKRHEAVSRDALVFRGREDERLQNEAEADRSDQWFDDAYGRHK